MRALQRKAENRGQARGAAGAAGEHAEALRIALDAVEQQRRRVGLLDVQLADRAELEVPVGALDGAQLAQALDRAEPAYLKDLEKAGAEPFAHPNEEKFMGDEAVRWAQIIKATGFKAQ